MTHQLFLVLHPLSFCYRHSVFFPRAWQLDVTVIEIVYQYRNRRAADRYLDSEYMHTIAFIVVGGAVPELVAPAAAAVNGFIKGYIQWFIGSCL
jgi:hypothetical protein